MNVKQGDLAILVRSSRENNVGRICEVTAYVGTMEYPDTILYDAWIVQFCSPVEVDLLGDDGNFYTTMRSVALAADSWLRPISGPVNELETTYTKEEEHA